LKRYNDKKRNIYSKPQTKKKKKRKKKEREEEKGVSCCGSTGCVLFMDVKSFIVLSSSFLFVYDCWILVRIKLKKN